MRRTGSKRRAARADSAVLIAAIEPGVPEDSEWLNTFEKIQRNATLNANCNESPKVIEPIQFKPEGRGRKLEDNGGEYFNYV